MTQTEICEVCGRERRVEYPRHHEDCANWRRAATLYAVADSYGCDTGCEGYRLYAVAENGEIIAKGWVFGGADTPEHATSTLREWSRKYTTRDIPVDLTRTVLGEW